MKYNALSRQSRNVEGHSTGERTPALEAVLGYHGMYGPDAMMRQGYQDANYFFRGLPNQIANALTGATFEREGINEFGPQVRNALSGNFDQKAVNAANQARSDKFRNIINGLDPRGDIYTAIGYAGLWPKAAYGTVVEPILWALRDGKIPNIDYGPRGPMRRDFTQQEVDETDRRWTEKEHIEAMGDDEKRIADSWDVY